MSEYIIAFFLITGSLFVLLSALGYVKMPDIYMRMSATTKASTLGVSSLLIAAAIFFDDIGVSSRAVIIILFLMITSPVAAHMIGRAAYFDKVPLWKGTIKDDLKKHYEEKDNKPGC